MARPTRTLHEAIRLVLEELPNQQASADDVCRLINDSRLYLQKDGGQPFAEQVFLRARNYPGWFEVDAERHIKLIR